MAGKTQPNRIVVEVKGGMVTTIRAERPGEVVVIVYASTDTLEFPYTSTTYGSPDGLPIKPLNCVAAPPGSELCQECGHKLAAHFQMVDGEGDMQVEQPCACIECGCMAVVEAMGRENCYPVVDDDEYCEPEGSSICHIRVR